MKKFLFVILLSSAQALAQVHHLPTPVLETLPNGLQIAWFLNDHLPITDVALLVNSGYRDDPVGKSGTAELMSAGLDRGAAGLSAREIAHSIEILGASRYISVDDDTMSIGIHGLAPDADKLLDLMGKMVLKPDLKPAEISREQARILDRWSHISDTSATLVSLGYQRTITAGTSYGRGSLISAAEFKKINHDDVVGFYKKHFTPKNSILMIVGRVDQAEFKKKIESSFGAWQGEAPKRDWRPFTDSRTALGPNKVLLVDKPDQTQTEIRIGFKAPSVHAPEHYALTVANALLGEYFNSRLNSLIRDKLGLTYSITSAFSYSRDFSSFTIASATKTENVGKLIAKSIEVLRDLKKGPIPEGEAQTAKEFLLGGFPLGTATLGAVASRWLSGHVLGLGENYLNEFIPKVQEVTAAQVLKAVSKDFDLDHLVIVVAGPGPEIKKSMAAAKLGPIKQVTAASLQ